MKLEEDNYSFKVSKSSISINRISSDDYTEWDRDGYVLTIYGYVIVYTWYWPREDEHTVHLTCFFNGREYRRKIRQKLTRLGIGRVAKKFIEEVHTGII